MIATNNLTTIMFVVGGKVGGKRDRLYKRVLTKISFSEKENTSDIDVDH